MFVVVVRGVQNLSRYFAKGLMYNCNFFIAIMFHHLIFLALVYGFCQRTVNECFTQCLLTFKEIIKKNY